MVVSAIIAECIAVSWALVTYVGYHTPLSFLVNSVLAVVVVVEIMLVSGGLKGQVRDVVQPYVES